MSLITDFLLGLVKLVFSFSAVLWFAVVALFVIHRIYKSGGSVYSNFTAFAGNFLWKN